MKRSIIIMLYKTSYIRKGNTLYHVLYIINNLYLRVHILDVGVQTRNSRYRPEIVPIKLEGVSESKVQPLRGIITGMSNWFPISRDLLSVIS